VLPRHVPDGLAPAVTTNGPLCRSMPCPSVPFRAFPMWPPSQGSRGFAGLAGYCRLLPSNSGVTGLDAAGLCLALPPILPNGSPKTTRQFPGFSGLCWALPRVWPAFT
jgi:hypothetical protein